MGSSSGSDRYAREAAREEAKRKADIAKGTVNVRTMFAQQFTPDFYDQISQNFMDYYNPQLQQQVDASNEQLTGALGRGGNLGGMVPELDEHGRFTGRYVNRAGGGSSVAIDKFADLEEQHNIKRTELVDRAIQEANEKRQAVQQTQDNILLQLQSTADASGAAADAAASSQYLQAPAAYDPLGQIFTDATFGLATQADLERRGQARYNTGLFGGASSTSGETVG